MDPSLEKIRDNHIGSIKSGRYAQPMREAKHYLSVILKNQEIKQQTELKEFALNIQELNNGQG